MKDSFPGYYPLSEAEMNTFFEKSLIIFDVNALLDLFRIELSHASQVLDVLENDNIKNRLWIPFDTAWLYHQNMNKEIISQVNNINTVLKHLTSCKDIIDNAKSYPFLPNDKKESLKHVMTEIVTSCTEQKADLVNQLKECSIKNRLGELFHDKMGKEYDDAQLNSVYSEGQKRFQKLIPPGYIPNEMSDQRKKYHDLIVWKQILAYSKDKHKDVILVTGLIKEDWYYVVNEEEVVPRQELINEFMRESGKRYYSFSLSRFIKECVEKLHIDIPNDVALVADLREKVQYASVQEHLLQENQI